MRNQTINALRFTAVSLSLGLAATSYSTYAANLTATVTGGGTQVSESGAVDHYTLVLTAKPTAEVTIGFVLDGQLLVYPRAVKFQPESYNLPQTITVSAVNDETPERAHKGMISHTLSSMDRDFSGVDQAPVEADIADDDLASMSVTQSGDSSQVAEGGAQDSYTLALSARPVADVTVSVRTVTPDGERPGPAGSAQMTVTPTSITFTPSDWHARTITLTAVDDAKVDGEQRETLEHVVSSTDSAYSQISIDQVGKVEVSIGDNDSPGILLSETAGATRLVEGGATDSYTLVLASEPATSVAVTLLAGDPDQITVNPPRVSFNPTNYSTPQTITVSAVDDVFGEGRHAVSIAHSVSSSDLAYQGVTLRPVLTSITDNDIPAELVSETGDSSRVTEGGAKDSYTMVLTTRPSENVAIDIHTGSQVSASPARVTFGPDNYTTPQTITLAGVNDLVVEDTRLDTMTHSVSSADFGYDGVAVDAVIATVTDNDVRSAVLSETGGSTQVTEGAADGDRYSIALSAQPLSDVTITLNTDPQLSANPASLTFTPDNFATPQTVMVSAVNNEVADGMRMAGISHSASSSDPDYNVPVAALSISITDDDVAAILLEQTEGSTAVAESGATDRYTLRLATQPVQDVVMAINPGSQLLASESTLTFTAANYNQPQTIELYALDDSEVEGAHFGTVTHAVSGDSAYEGMRVNELAVDIADNDVVPQVEPVEPVAPSSNTSGGSLSWLTLAGLLALRLRRKSIFA